MTNDATQGQRIDRYLLHGALGKGASAEVWLAWDQGRREPVVMKLARRVRPAGSDAFFEREAELLSAMNHPGVPPLLGFGRTRGRPYLVMPWYPARTLRECFMDSAEVSDADWWDRVLAEFLPAFAGVLRAVEYAHRFGVVHRDIKPDNMLVETGGRGLLIDWGLAVGDIRPAEPDAITSRMRFGGTAGYISPERVTDDTSRWDPRIDQWSLGAVLFEILTGDRLFPQDDPRDRLEDTMKRSAPDPRDLAPGLPTALADVCRRSLSYDRRRRFGDVTAMRRALEVARVEAGRVHRRPRPSRVESRESLRSA